MLNLEFDSKFLQRYLNAINIEEIRKNKKPIIIDGKEHNLGQDITQRDIDMLMSLGISIEFRSIEFKNKEFRNANFKYLGFHDCGFENCNFSNCNIEELKGVKTNFGDDLSVLYSIRGIKKLDLHGEFIDKASFFRIYPGLFNLDILDSMPESEIIDVLNSLNKYTLYYVADDIDLSNFPELEELHFTDFIVDEQHHFKGEQSLHKLKKLVLRRCYNV